MKFRMDFSDSEGEYLSQDEEVGSGHQEGMIGVFQDGFRRLVEYYGTSGGEMADDEHLALCSNVEKGLNSNQTLNSTTHSGILNLDSPVIFQPMPVSVSFFTGSSHDLLNDSTGVMECQQL